MPKTWFITGSNSGMGRAAAEQDEANAPLPPCVLHFVLHWSDG